MKIFTKVLSVVAIICLAFCLCILPVSAAPAYTEGGFANEDFLIRPLFADVELNDGVYRVPLSLGTGLVNQGAVNIYSDNFSILSSAVSLRVSHPEASLLTVSFDSLMLPLSDFSRILGNASISGLRSCYLSGVFYDVDHSTSQSFTLDFYDNESSYFDFGNAVFDIVALNTTVSHPFAGVGLSTLQNYISTGLGFEFVYIDSFLLEGVPVVFDGSTLGFDIGFNSPYRDTYYSSFEFPVDQEIIYVDEQPDLVAWIYDVLQGLFSLQIFGDVTLGTLLLVAISVPLLVSMLKAIAGG